jgi:hypothetical protein
MTLRLWLVSYWARNPRTMRRNLVCAADASEACSVFRSAHGLRADARHVGARVIADDELAMLHGDGLPIPDLLTNGGGRDE